MFTEDNFYRRVEFPECFLIRCEAEPDFPQQIMWTDEASFKLNGQINKHNSVYWSDSDPHEFIQEELNVTGLTVWAGIWSGGIVGPYFFDGTVTGESCLEMLREVILPELEYSSLYDNTEIIWQQTALHRITVYEFENSLVTAFRGGSDGVVQLTGLPDHVISRHVIFRCDK
jgi:hypothetical protein